MLSITFYNLTNLLISRRDRFFTTPINIRQLYPKKPAMHCQQKMVQYWIKLCFRGLTFEKNVPGLSTSCLSTGHLRSLTPLIPVNATTATAMATVMPQSAGRVGRLKTERLSRECSNSNNNSSSNNNDDDNNNHQQQRQQQQKQQQQQQQQLIAHQDRNKTAFLMILDTVVAFCWHIQQSKSKVIPAKQKHLMTDWYLLPFKSCTN